jgi:hypothetical protein
VLAVVDQRISNSRWRLPSQRVRLSAQNEKTRSGGYPQVHRRILQPSTEVTELWQPSQISGLRILALRIRHRTPRLLKAAGASRCGHPKCSCFFGSSTATCFRAGSTNSSQFCDAGQFGTSRSREVIATKSDCPGSSAFSGQSGCLENVGSAPSAFRRSEEE